MRKLLEENFWRLLGSLRYLPPRPGLCEDQTQLMASIRFVSLEDYLSKERPDLRQYLPDCPVSDALCQG